MFFQYDLVFVFLFVGVFIGVGLGIIFKFGGMIGGVDIIVCLVNKYFGILMGRMMFVFDVCVIILFLFIYFFYKEVMYILVVVFVVVRLIDFIQEGGYVVKGVMIIFLKNDLIQKKIFEEME